MNLKDVLEKNVSNLIALPLGIALLVGIIFAGSIYHDIHNPINLPIQVVKIVPEVKYVHEPIQYKTVEVPVKIMVPTKIQEKKLESDFKLDPSKFDPLSVVKIPDLPNGAEGVIKRDKDTGQVSIDIKPNKPEFFKFGGKWFADAQFRQGLGWQDQRLEMGKNLFQIGPGKAYVALGTIIPGKPYLTMGFRVEW